jgi:hypothetical protein
LTGAIEAQASAQLKSYPFTLRVMSGDEADAREMQTRAFNQSPMQCCILDERCVRRHCAIDFRQKLRRTAVIAR